jgi:hypothetical protein
VRVLAIATAAAVAALLWTSAQRDPEAGDWRPRAAAVPPVATEPRAAATAAPGAAELRAAPDGGEEGAGFALRMLGPDGEPLAHARVVVFTGDEVLGAAETDERGRAELPARARRGELGVHAAGTPPYRAPFDAGEPDEAGRGEVDVRIPLGEVVAGRVLVDGAPPAEPLVLTLQHDNLFAWIEPFPVPVLHALHTTPQAYLSADAPTAPDGAFRFAGLPAAWSGRLSWSGDAYRREEEDWFGFDALDLPAARDDLVLRLGSVVHVRARIVTLAGAPVEDAELSAPGRVPAVSDGSPDGVAELDLVRPLPAEVVFALSSWTLRPGCSHRFALRPPATGAAWDLGEIVLPPPPALLVRVVDPAGAPIAGADVGLHGSLGDAASNAWRTLATDAEGHARDRFCAGLRAIRVEAHGFAPRWLEGPFDPVREIEVVLAPSAALTVRVAGGPAGAVRHLFAAVSPRPDAPPGGVRRSRGDSGLPAWRREAGALSVGFGGTRFAPLESGVGHVVRVYDSAAHVLHESAHAPLAAGEEREVTVALEWKPVALWLRVLGSGGAGAHGAEIAVDGLVVARADRFGEAQLPAIAPGAVDLRITHPEHADLRLPAFELPLEEGWIELRMSAR